MCANRSTSYRYRVSKIMPPIKKPWATLALLSFLLALALWVADAHAQTTAVCTSTPTSGQRIVCEEDMDVDIEINAQGIDIDTNTRSESGIEVGHFGDADIEITVSASTEPQGARSAIDTTGEAFASAIEANGKSDGDIRITVSSSDFTTTGIGSLGVNLENSGEIGNVFVSLNDTTISTQGRDSEGIYVDMQADGMSDIDFTRGSITTEGSDSNGIEVLRKSTGDIEIRTFLGSITTSGDDSSGIVASQLKKIGRGDGDILIVSSSDISVKGEVADAVFADIAAGITGLIKIDYYLGDIETKGDLSFGIQAIHKHAGGIYIDVHSLASIITRGDESAHGIRAIMQGISDEISSVNVIIRNASVTTHGLGSDAVHGYHRGTGDLNIKIEDAAVTTESTVLHENGNETFSMAVLGTHAGAGDINIDVRDSQITTRGVHSYGIRAASGVVSSLLPSRPSNFVARGNAHIEVRNGSTIRTHGRGGHGIFAWHWSGEGELRVDVREDANVHASGAGANAVQVGQVRSGNVDSVAEIGADGYRRQVVTVNGRVMGGSGGAAGVFLAGGGRVVIAPMGTIGAASGIAILATGDAPGAMEEDPAIKPRLLVSLNLDGRRLSQVIGDDWIINDGGETTILVNDVKLHHGADGVVLEEDGVTPVSIPNGAWDVTMRAEGVTVTDRDTDPADWVVSEPAANVVADRDFSAADFIETRATCLHGQVGAPPNCTPVAPSTCPEGQVGAPPNCTPTTEPETPMEPERPVIMEEYAPRAAVYEALPGFLLSLDAPGLEDDRLASPGSPVWARLSGGRGSYEPERATVGAEYDASRFSAEAGLDLSLGENVTGSVSVRHVRGSADVSSPAKGGKIEADGLGFSLGLAVDGGSFYAKGGVSLTSYDADFSSITLGSLARGVGALVSSLSVEAGRRMAMSGNLRLSPRVWMTGAALEVDDFTDAVASRVSVKDAERLTGGLGVVAGTERAVEDGTLSLRGSLDVAQIFSGEETSVDVSGERLESESARARILLGLGGTYRKGRFSLSAQVEAGGLGSGDERYSGRVSLGWRF